MLETLEPFIGVFHSQERDDIAETALRSGHRDWLHGREHLLSNFQREEYFPTQSEIAAALDECARDYTRTRYFAMRAPGYRIETVWNWNVVEPVLKTWTRKAPRQHLPVAVQILTMRGVPQDLKWISKVAGYSRIPRQMKLDLEYEVWRRNWNASP